MDREETAAKNRVEQWLKACDADHANGLSTSTSSIGDLVNNEGLFSAMNTVLLATSSKNSETVVNLCATLFDMYRSDEPGFKECVFQLLPSMICSYLNFLQSGDSVTKRGPCQSLEVILLGIYNREVYDHESGAPKPLVKFRFPSLALGSIYHDPGLLQSNMLTESALRRLETGHHVKLGPLPQVARLDSENRTSVLSAILYCYSCHLTSYCSAALQALCLASVRMASQGFPFDSSSSRFRFPGSGEDEEAEDEFVPRIPLSSQILLHIISCVYYALYKGCALPARLAVEAIHKRACLELMPDVLMVTEAVKHAIEASGDVESPTASPTSAIVNHSSGAIDITANLARPRGSVTQLVLKNIITNASFRTKKLPEDIPVQDLGTGSAGETSLSSITEEKEETKAEAKEHKESKLGTAKKILAHGREVLAEKAEAQKKKALKIAGKINPSSNNTAVNNSSDPVVTVDGVGIEMAEFHDK